ncbi:hypothetical protein Q31b_00880 [Novipirellula aureliae]|uniref:Uncharacterized protein n=1 Tax=Novipirellula aureliae TaxID=2527966 RepID=A0A5C6EAC2_9BACT|nr:hypothetical protein [Novipirellula aureliae]TWU44917.1 hypothetical protein Q31b_00880 [Novipirellula aureliae]
MFKSRTNETTISDNAKKYDPYDQRTYGNVWTRVWKNHDRRGQAYLTFSQHRLYEQDGVQGVAKSFRTEDFEDVIRGAQWVAGVVATLSANSEPRQPQRRTQNVRPLPERQAN